MLNTFTTLLSEVTKLTWNKVLLLFITITLLIGGYWIWGAIEQSHQKITHLEERLKKFDARSTFEDEFDLEGVSFETKVQDILETLQIQSGGGWVLLWGFHDSRSVGPIHLKRVSVIGESVNTGNKPLFDNLQNLNVSLFVDAFLIYWSERNVKHHWIPTLGDSNYRSFMTSMGLYWQTTVPIYLPEYDDQPIGVLGVYFNRTRAIEVSKDKELQEELESLILQGRDQITFQFTRKQKKYQ